MPKALIPLLKQGPLNEADFKIVRTDVDQINFKAQSNKFLIIALSGLVGLLLGLIYIMLRHVVEMRSSMAKPA